MDNSLIGWGLFGLCMALVGLCLMFGAFVLQNGDAKRDYYNVLAIGGLLGMGGMIIVIASVIAALITKGLGQ